MSEKINRDNFEESCSAGLFDAINDFEKKQREIAQDLEELPFEQEHFSAEDIKKVIDIRKQLSSFVKKSEKDSNPEVGLADAIKYLDSLDCWIFKFGTGEVGKTAKTDSVYYVMPNGISLRLKRINMKKGLKYVVEPFMECIVFEKDGKPTEELDIGPNVREFCSQEFNNLQNQDSPAPDEGFTSKVKKYYKDGKLYFAERPNNLFHDHFGDDVNKIYKINI